MRNTMRSMSESFQATCSLLDEGLSLYRRHFVSFLLITACWFVPIAIAVGLIIAAEAWLDETLVVIFVLITVLLSFPILIYLIGGLSRAASAAIEGQPVRILSAFAIHPLRALGMGCYSIIYAIIAWIGSSVLSLVCICPLYFVSISAIAGVTSLSNGTNSISFALGLLFGVVFASVYLFTFVISGATYSSLIYSLQPWIQELDPFGKAFQRSFEVIGYRVGRNLIAWSASALLITAIGITVTLTIGVLVPLPLIFVLGNDSHIAQAVSATAWILGLIFVLPPLPIWMTLLYRRNVAEHEGIDLDAKIQIWWRECFGA